MGVRVGLAARNILLVAFCHGDVSSKSARRTYSSETIPFGDRRHEFIITEAHIHTRATAGSKARIRTAARLCHKAGRNFAEINTDAK